MKKITEEEFNRNWLEFLNYFNKSGLSSKINPDELLNAMRISAAAINEDSGISYPGSLLKHINYVCGISERISKMIGNTFPIDGESLFKVCILHQISKAEMFIPNDNQWEIEKRGLNYKFNELPGCLKVGERSIMNAYSAGINFTPEEFEAMRVLDRTSQEIDTVKNHLGILSIIIKSANDIAYALEKQQWKKENNN